jgi:hypothetical protein
MSEIPDPKSRWKESEWWLTIGTIILGILIKVGVINTSTQAIATEVLNDVIALVMIVGPVIGWQFVRTKKKIAERFQPPKDEGNIAPPKIC